MVRSIKELLDTKSPFVTTYQAIMGYKAVLMTWSSELDMYEPWETGFGFYKSHKEAEVEALEWADAEGHYYKPYNEK